MKITSPLLFKVFCLLICLAPGLVQAKVQSKPIEYQDNGLALKGWLYWDDSVQGRRPGVLVAHEWWGLNDYVKSRAGMLAKLGYVALAMDMYGDGRVTAHGDQAKAWMDQITANVDAWQKRGLLALELLRREPLVDPGRLAAIGYCFGGATVMQMAYGGADLKGVVSFHGSLPVAGQAQRGRIKAKILAATGAADAFVPMDQVLAFEKGLDEAGATWEMAIYGGARHGFTNPGAGEFGIANIAYDARADSRSWELMRGFLEEVFAGK